MQKTHNIQARDVAAWSTSRKNDNFKANLKLYFESILNIIRNYIRIEQMEWHHKVKLRPVKLTNGEVSSGLLMRRKIDRQWEYRHPTDEEVEDYDLMNGW